MLDMGFIDEIQFILDLAPEDRVMSLYSATMPTEILRLSEEYLNNPKQFLLSADDLSGDGIDQSYLVIKDRDKFKYLIDFIKPIKRQCIVFCSTKYRTRDVAKFLHQEKFNAVAIEGDMSQHHCFPIYASLFFPSPRLKHHVIPKDCKILQRLKVETHCFVTLSLTMLQSVVEIFGPYVQSSSATEFCVLLPDVIYHIPQTDLAISF